MENYPSNSLPLATVNYGYQDYDNIIRSENIPTKNQIRTRQLGSMIPVQFKFTGHQLSIWESWVYNYINDGVDWFSMQIMMNGGLIDATIRLVGKYSVQDIGPDAYSVGATIETSEKTAIVPIEWINDFHTLVNITMPTELGGSGWI